MNNSSIFSQSALQVALEDSAPCVFLDSLLPGSVHLVIGAPKSGKTTKLRGLVRHLEKLGHEPEQILVVTPSRATANSLRIQIAIDSKRPAGGSRARSVSSLAYELIQGANPDQKLLSGAAQELILRELIEESIQSNEHKGWGLEAASLKLAGFRAELRDLLQVVLENQLDAQALKNLQSEYPKLSLQLMLNILPRYQARLAANNLLDPSALLVQAKELGQLGFADCKFVLVDDAVDFSIAGLEFIKQLSSKKSLVLFGDPDVSTQGFRSAGAAAFIERFPEAQKTFLQHGVWLAPAICELSTRLASRLPTSLAGLQRTGYLESKLAGDSKITSLVFDNQSAEADFMAATLRKARLQQNLEWTQMVVVARTRNQLEQLSSDLAARSVPTRVLGIQTALSSQFAARSILMVSKASFSELEQAEIELLLESPFCQLDSLGIRRLLRQLALLEENQGLNHSQILANIFEFEIEPSTPEFRKLNRLISLIRNCKDLENASSSELVSRIWSDGPGSSWQTLARGNAESAMAANRDLDSVLSLFAAAARFDERSQGTAKDFLAFQLGLAIPEDSLAQQALRPAVILATPAQLSGLSAQLVFLPRLQDGIWPNLKPRSSLLGAASLQAFLSGKLDSPELSTRSELADESRMLLKALTTAQGLVFMTCIATVDEQPSQFFPMLGLEPEAIRDGVEFDLRRMVGKLRKALARGDFEAAPVLAALALAGAPGAHPEHWQGLLKVSTLEPIYDPSDEVKISASKVEAFEKCPLHWFIATFGGDSSGFEASLGTLIHSALEAAKNPGDLESYVESNWHTLEFETAWQEKAQKRKAMGMLAALTSYLGQAGTLVEAEQGFSLHMGRLNILGKIDRIEQDSSGALFAVDLKTGKTPTRAEGAVNRQIALYQLALQESYPDKVIAGGKLVYVGQGKLSVIEQQTLEGEFREEILQVLAEVELGAGGNSFQAHFDEHCSQDGKCQLLIGKVITNA